MPLAESTILAAMLALQAAPSAPATPAGVHPQPAPRAPAAAPSVVAAEERPAGPVPPQVASALPPVPATPGAPTEVVACQPFTLQADYTHRCRRDGGPVRSGHLVVVRAAAGFVVPRQVAEPVACFGSQTAERLWSSPGRGLAIYLVPAWDEGPEGARRPGNPLTDLVYFASPELPERVDAAWIAAERARAEAALRSGALVPPVRPASAARPAIEPETVDNLMKEAERLLPRDPEVSATAPRSMP